MGHQLKAGQWGVPSHGLVQHPKFKHSELSFNNPDWVMLAECFGCKGVHVEESGGLMAGLEESFAADTPAILSLPIDYRENLKLTERLGEIACPI